MHRAALVLAIIAALGAPCAAVVHPDPATDPLLLLPKLPKPKWRDSGPPPAGDGVMSNSGALRMVRDQAVLMDGFLNMDKGPADGMEVVACMRDGKCHEALVRVDLGGTDGRFVKFACIAALKLPDGQPSGQGSGTPARGTPVRVLVYWKDDDGKWHVIDASSLIRDRDLDQNQREGGYPPLPFVYTGSRTAKVLEARPDGSTVERDHFMLDSTRSLVVAFDEADALLESPFPGARENARFEANSSITPPVGAKVVLALEPATLPLTLLSNDAGELRQTATGPKLEDEQLQALLASSYSMANPELLRAVGIAIPRYADTKVDRQLRSRILAVAAKAKAWVVPIFELRPE
jgi:hypothetical protein